MYKSLKKVPNAKLNFTREGALREILHNPATPKDLPSVLTEQVNVDSVKYCPFVDRTFITGKSILHSRAQQRYEWPSELLSDHPSSL